MVLPRACTPVFSISTVPSIRPPTALNALAPSCNPLANFVSPLNATPATETNPAPNLLSPASSDLKPAFTFNTTEICSRANASSVICCFIFSRSAPAARLICSLSSSILSFKWSYSQERSLMSLPLLSMLSVILPKVCVFFSMSRLSRFMLDSKSLKESPTSLMIFLNFGMAFSASLRLTPRDLSNSFTFSS